MKFLTSYPLESLTVSTPLLSLFKSLCASQPEIPTYGKVYPSVPTSAGPLRRDDLIRIDHRYAFLPNIPGIFALLEDLKALIAPTTTGVQPRFPTKGRHIPVESTAAVFNHHSFPAEATRSAKERWYFVTSGLQYPCEADKKIHETFAERYDSFMFPATAADDDLRSLSNFMSMGNDLSWFAQVRDVAAAEAAYFHGSGTLADCTPYGVPANQVCAEYIPPAVPVTAPTKNADPKSVYPFRIKLHTTARDLPPLAETLAATAQTHIRMYPSHPYLGSFGSHKDHGPFWQVRPIESSRKDDSSYLSLKGLIRGMLKPKG
jgi:hypothetical protein